MKSLFTTAITLILTLSSTAQTGYTREDNRMLDDAKELYARGDHFAAAELYKKLLLIDTNFTQVYYELAMCEKHIPLTRDLAEVHFEKGVREGHTESHYELAGIRHRQERFDEALSLYESYKELYERLHDDKEVDRQIEILNYAKLMVKIPVDIRIEPMGDDINSTAHDYSPITPADGSVLYFTSRREGTTGGMADANGQPFEDIYVSHNDGERWSRAENAGFPMNTRTMDATVAMSADGNTMLLYRTSRDLVGGNILITRKEENGNWSEPQPLNNVVNSNYFEPSAALSEDGNTIYFTSDRPGGFGGRDIWRVKLLPHGEWSKPLNMGAEINTPYDEDSPFLHSDGQTLFFSSNGHQTMGGYDIFRSILVDPDMNVWSTPENMGYPFNTVKDDIYFSLTDDGRVGYLSSERPGGMGMQDIYRVVFPVSKTNYMVVKGKIVSPEDEPVEARIMVEDAGFHELHGVYKSDPEDGSYTIVLAPGRSYDMKVEALGYADQATSLTAPVGLKEFTMDLRLAPDPNGIQMVQEE
jgi:tetratricopeptide (TPR) repeat protein